MKRLKKTNPDIELRFGFHAIPSMKQLHAHLISQDFDSEFLKTKKHWNSFNTDYFVPFGELMDIISEKGIFEVKK